MNVLDASNAGTIKSQEIRPNPSNPRLYFNEDSLDQLKTSIQEVGILVPVIVYASELDDSKYVLLDGERRWRCSLDLGIERIPANIIAKPNELENLLRMFNIHSVRDEWPLISVALSLRKVVAKLGDDRETQLAEVTGLTRGTVRRAKRLLSLPAAELALIESEADWDRKHQVHREDLYLEIEAAVSVILNELPEIGEQYTREEMIRQFVRKREDNFLRAVTDFRLVAKLVKASGFVGREKVVNAVERLIRMVELNPADVYEEIAAASIDQRDILRRSETLLYQFEELGQRGLIDESSVSMLRKLRDRIDQLIEDR